MRSHTHVKNSDAHRPQMTALTVDGRPGGTFLIFFGGVSERWKRKKTKTIPQSRKFMRQRFSEVLQILAGGLHKSPRSLASQLTEHAFQRPPTIGGVRSVEWRCGFYAGRGQAIRIGHGHLPWQELESKEELIKFKLAAQKKKKNCIT